MTQTSDSLINDEGNNEFIPSSEWGEDVIVDEALVEKNFQAVKKQIAHSKVKIIAVTKYFGINAMKAAYAAGVRDFGESRAIEAAKKIESLPEDIKADSTFHFIGHLQTNKVQKVVKNFDVIHSIDSLKIAKAVSNAACLLNKREKVLLQVNNAGEAQKSGYTKSQLKEELQHILQLNGLEVIGLMNMAPINATDNELAMLFDDVRCFRDDLEREYGISLKELSMGMSRDYKIAVKEGATMIRVGRILFK